MGAAGFYKVPFEDVPELVKTRKARAQALAQGLAAGPVS